MEHKNEKRPDSPLASGDGGDKTLLLIRHAKSSWEVGTLTDFERPLNDRGTKDAPAMAKRLKSKNIAIDAFVSSPAKRAKKQLNFLQKLTSRITMPLFLFQNCTMPIQMLFLM